MKKLVLYLCVVFTIFSPMLVSAKEKEINLHLFYSETCRHCHEEMEFLDEYLKDKENIKLYQYEILNTSDNKKIFDNVQILLDKPARGVPYLVIGNQVINGFSNQVKNEIKGTIEYYLKNNYRDLVGEELGIVEKKENIILEDEINKSENLTIPILGEINPKTFSLPLIAIVIGTVDGFNPCAMWILIFLITMLFGMKDRRKTWILGITFLLTSAITYLLFMVSWLNIAVFMNQITFIRAMISLFAIAFGVYNLLSFFKQEEDGCEVVDDKKRKAIISRIRKIVSEKKFVLAFLGIILLAVSVNIIELMCSLGLPVVFTQILSLNNLTKTEYTMYMLLYILFFLIDDLIIFFIAMKTMKIKGISNRYTKYSHLIGGVIMLLIGLLMLFKPEWLMFHF